MQPLQQNTCHDKLNTLINFAIKQPPEEEWREIEDTDGLYFVSSFGRVLSLYNHKPRVLKPWLSSGYYYVRIKGSNFRVNRLVALAFIPNPDKKPVAHHIDGDKTNNMKSNLSFVTYSENTQEYYTSRTKQNIDTECASGAKDHA